MIDKRIVDELFALGYSVAPVAFLNDAPTRERLAFRDEVVPGDSAFGTVNLAITRPDLMVVRKPVVLPGDRNALDDLFPGAPVVDAPHWVSYVVTWSGHDRWIPGRVHGSRLLGCELLPHVLAPQSLLSGRDGLCTVSWRDPASTQPQPASRELVAELVRAAVLPHRALESYETSSRVNTRPTEATA